MSRRIETNVLVVGGGPVGVTLALDLAWRGIDVTIVETRYAGEAPSVKCNHVSAKTMEIFRRLGVANAIRAAGLPDDHPNDVVFRTAMTGLELSRIRIPSRAKRFTDRSGPDGWWPTPEPPHRVNQIFLEPILFNHAKDVERISILSRTQFESYTQDEKGVTALARDLDTGEDIEIRAQFMVGCDGGRSAVRHMIGAKLHGMAVVQNVQSTHINAPGLMERLPGERAWMYISVNPRRYGTVISIDGKDRWLIHNYLQNGETDFDDVDRDWAIRAILGVDEHFPYEIISKEDWVGRRLVADKFRDRRVFICGDASHLWIPFAGYGMNAGIADAANLASHLAAYLNGWGGARVLDAYESERMPITNQVSHFAMDMALKNFKDRSGAPAEIEYEGAQGDAARERLGRQMYELNVQQFCCGGLNFGYFYDQSPIIVYNGEPQPGYTMYDFTPAAVPGCRTPHLWLDDGRSLYDCLAPDYTLLRTDRSINVEPLLAAARDRKVPLAVLDIEQPDARTIYGKALTLSRPDQHVGWADNAVPSDPGRLIDTIRGAAI